MHQHEGQVAEDLGVVRLERNGHARGFDRLDVAAVDQLQQGEHGVRSGVLGIQLQRLPGRVVGDLARHRRGPEKIVVVAPDVHGDARDAGMRIGEIGIQIDRL